MAAIRDVFISYAHADQAWVEVLAENLHQSGLEVFFDEWEIGPGDVLVHRLDEGLRARNGVLVVSPVALERPWVQQEYAAMVTRAVDKQLRLIPVLLKDAEMPPLLASRVWVDFRGADGPVYEARVRELVTALKGERRGPPPRTGGPLKPPPNTGFQAQGPIRRTLRIDSTTATLSGGNEVIQAPVRGLERGFEDLLWRVSRARRNWGAARDPLPRSAGARDLETLLDEVGRRLGEAFLPAPVAEAERLNSPLELALELNGSLAELPWETLRLPGDGAASLPLALHPRVDLYRRLKGNGAAPAVKIPGPLRILVAIGSPEAQNTRGELLDMEAELRRILDAVEPARRKGHAAVRILEYGTVDAIRAALEQERYHVLYISCHAAPGVLILEDGDGGEDRVNAGRLWREALPAGRSVALAVLAGCSTARDVADGSEAKEEVLPGVARDLVAHGVPAVIAMQGPVGDRYATKLAGALFEALAIWEEPLPQRALAEARRAVERERQEDQTPRQPPPEWPTPALFTARDPLPLYDTAADFEAVEVTAEPRFDWGVVARRIGDMVGRRREQRLLLRALRSEARAGVLVHGIGGVGKSTLVAQVLHRLAEEGRLLASLYGAIDVDQVFAEVGGRLFDHCLAQGHDERHPLRQVSVLLREPKILWRERLDHLSRHVLGAIPLVFLFDNFEDNLDADRQVKGDLGELLALWLENPGQSRLAFTCRYPFRLPEEMEDDALEALHLGPLSLAETRKLVWRLPGLDALEPPELQRAYEEVGGHPRALEYLDALLRGGAARFPDVERRLKKALKSRGVSDPKRWRADTQGKLDAALAETVTLAADDVLLDALLKELEGHDLARRLLIGASVYRVPVDERGLIFQVGVPVERPADPERKQRLERVNGLVRQAQEAGKPTDAAFLGMTAEDVQQHVLDLQQELAPPVDPPEGFEDARARLEALTLLAPVEGAGDEALHWFVHRWTAGALARRASEEERTAAHRAAAAFWRWREDMVPQPRELAIEDLLEARHHHHAAGETDMAVEVTEWAISQLETWGAWEREERLLRESLTWVPQRSRKAAVFLYHLGNLAYRRGDYDQALVWYRQSLAIVKALGDRAGIASSYHQLGMVAQDRGDYDQALEEYRKSLAIFEALGDRAGMASSYGQLGNVDCLRGDYDQALEWCRKSLAIREALGDRANMARSYHQLGIVAQYRGDYDQALEWYRKSLAIREALGDRAGMASTISQIGILSMEQDDAEDGISWNLRSLIIRLEINVPEMRIDLYHLAHQREMLGEGRFREIVSRYLSQDDTDWLIELLN
jgi:tetratricopeptide (TPR) repeat protein